MATISPIQIALRDLGTGVGGVLEREAERRRMALEAQRQQGQLSLQQAQLANEAKLNEGKLGVSLAEVGMKGRQFEQERELKERGLTLQQEAQRDTAAYQKGSLGIQQQQAETAKAQQQATARYQQGTLTQQQNQLNVMKPLYAAQAEDFSQQARVRKMQADELQRGIIEGDKPVNIGGVLKAYHAMWSQSVNPEYANMMQGFVQAYFTATHPDVTSLPKDAEGNPTVPTRDANKIIEQIQPLGQAYVQHKLKTSVPLDQQIKIVTDTFSKQSDAKQAQGLSAYMMEVLPMFKNLEGYNAALRTLEEVIEGKGGIRETETVAYRQERKLSPTAPLPKTGADAIQKAVDTARAAGQRQIQSQILGEEDMAAILQSLQRRGGVPPQATTVVPTSTGVAVPGPSLAAATQPSTAVGTPEWLAGRYRQGTLSQELVLQTLQQRHGMTEDQALMLLYPTPESAITDAVRGRKTPPLDAPTIKTAVRAGKIPRLAGETLLQRQFGVSRDEARAFMTQP